MALTEVNSLGIKDLEVKTGDIAADAVTGAKIADDQINSEHYAAASIDHEHLANDCVDGDNIADDAINSEHYVDASIDHQHLANDCVDGDNLADNACDSEHYTDGSVDHVHLAGDCVDGDNLADNACDSEHYTDGSIDHVHLAADAVDGDNIADDSINSEHYVNGSIDEAHIADDQVTLAKMAGLARGKLIVGDSSGNPAALAAGSNDQVLTMDANGDVGWETAGGGLDGVTTGSGNVTITDGNLIVASGHGIDFSATGDGSGTDSSELLDDYEEGTWTPYFHLGSSPGAVTNSSLYQYQYGKYTKVGRLVVAVYSLQGHPQNSNFDQWSSGDGFIKGFPYDFAGTQPQTYAFNTIHSPTNQWGTTYAPYVTYENYSDKAHMGGYNSGGVEPPGNFGNHMRWTGTLTYAI